MMNPYAKGNNAYKKAAVTTKDQGTLIIMLYDGAIRFLKTAIIKLEKNDLEASHNFIVKSKNIISELMVSLKVDETNKIAKDLQSLYTYMFNRLIDANIQKNVDYLREVLDLMEELRDGWKAVLDQKKQASAGQFNSRSAMKALNIQG